MYLSRVLLNDRKRETLHAIASPQLIHGAVESCFGYTPDSEGNRKRLLWRIDNIADKQYLLLLSEGIPKLTSLVQQFGYPDIQPQSQTKAYASFLERLCNGQRWQFRLRANPVHSSMKEANETTRRGKIYAHVTPEQQNQWLMSRTTASGFDIKQNELNLVHSEWKKFRKNNQVNREVVLRVATFEGVLHITDAEKFRYSLTAGIGRAKAYGCGLLTIMHIPGITHDG